MSADEGRAAGHPAGADAEESAAARRVLVIEDDPGIRDLLTDALLSDGYTVTATESALGAATLVRRPPPVASSRACISLTISLLLLPRSRPQTGAV